METKTILIIDDDIKIGKMLNRRLKKAGYSVVIADNGELGINTALEINPSLILLDIHMPEMDGYTVIKTLRAHNYSGLVAACSASVSARDTQKTIEAGCNYFISKPIGLDFENNIQTILERHNG